MEEIYLDLSESQILDAFTMDRKCHFIGSDIIVSIYRKLLLDIRFWFYFAIFWGLFSKTRWPPEQFFIFFSSFFITLIFRVYYSHSFPLYRRSLKVASEKCFYGGPEGSKWSMFAVGWLYYLLPLCNCQRLFGAVQHRVLKFAIYLH